MSISAPRSVERIVFRVDDANSVPFILSVVVVASLTDFSVTSASIRFISAL